MKSVLLVAGDGPLAAQLIPFVAGVVGPVLLYLALTERRLPRSLAAAAAVALASSPAHASYSYFVKQYTVEAVLSIAIAWCAWTVIDAPSRHRWFRLLVVVSLSLVTSASVAPMIVVAVAVAGLRMWRGAADRRFVAITAAATGALGAVWVLGVVAPNVSDLLREYWADYYVVTDSGFGEGLESLYARSRSVMSGLFELDNRIALAATVIAGVVAALKRPAVALLTIGPFAIAVLLAIVKLAPIGTGRTDVYLYPMFLVLIAIAVHALTVRLPRGVRGVVLSAVIAAALVSPFRVNLYIYPRQDVRPLVAILEERRAPEDAVLVYPWASFAVALYTSAPVALVRSSQYATGWRPRIDDPDITLLPNRLANPSEYQPIVEDVVHDRDTVWLISTQIHDDIRSIWDSLAEQGFVQTEVHERPGAWLELWTRAPPT